MLWLCRKEIKIEGFKVTFSIQNIGNILIIVCVSGLLLIDSFAPHEQKQETMSSPINCIEHVMVDGQPYCGMVKHNGIAYKVKMSDVESSILTADIQR